MLKIKYYILPVLAVFILSSCDKNSLGTDVQQTYYEGILVQEGPAPFLINASAGTVLHKGQEKKATISDNPAKGTVYGNYGSPGNVYGAVGGEELPAGSWVDNNRGKTFRLILNRGGTAEFAKILKVNIISANNLYYDDGSGNWAKISALGYISAKSIWAPKNNGNSNLTKISSAAGLAPGEFETCCVTNIGGGGQNN